MSIEEAILYCKNKNKISTDILEQINFNQIINYLTELKQYQLLAEKKQLIKLPCAAGDILYYINGPYLLECKISDFWIDETGIWNIITDVYQDDKTYELQINPDDFGEKVFLSKDDALNAQKKRN